MFHLWFILRRSLLRTVNIGGTFWKTSTLLYLLRLSRPCDKSKLLLTWINFSLLAAALQFNITRIFPTITHRVSTFNSFASIPPATDESEIRHQRISTRLFITVLFGAVIIIAGYISLVSVSRTITVQEPTVRQYSSLYTTYSQSLTCPCSQISINYDVFVRLRYTLHQVCSSIFVSTQWYQYLSDNSINQVLLSDDFRKASPYIFRALGLFCEISNKTISTRLDAFFSTQYVTATVTTLNLFQSQMQAAFEEFIASTRKSLLSSLQLIRDINQANGVMSITGRQYVILRDQENNNLARFSLFALTFHNCSCSSSAKCITTSNIFNSFDSTILFTMPDLYIGCTVTEALLQSSLICFYNQTCIDRFVSYLQFNSSIRVSALTTSTSDSYRINSTLQELVDQLMVGAWQFSIEHGSYFNACQPERCIFTQATRNDALYIITTLFGLIGGLSTVFRLIVPLGVKHLPRIIRRTRRATPMLTEPDDGKRNHKIDSDKVS